MSRFDYHSQQSTLYRLLTLPSVDTVKRLVDVMSQPPLRFDPFQTHHVTIARAYLEQDVAVLDSLHDALQASWANVQFQFETFDYRYDEQAGESKIAANVACNAIELIRQKLSMTGYPPVYQFLHHAPPLSKASKAFVISVADTLVMKEHSFTFDGLYLISEEDYQAQFRSQFITATWEAPWGQSM